MNYVTDTHSLVWYFTDDQRLSKRAFKAFEGTVKEGQIIVPMVVLAELMFIAKKGRVALGFADTIARIEIMDNFEIVPLDLDVLKMANRIESLLEMHDKLIVATALCYSASLITRDEQITTSKTVKIVW